MKKVTKGCVILAAVIGVIGAGLCLAGMIIGPDWKLLTEKLEEYSIWANDDYVEQTNAFAGEELETIYAKLDTDATKEYEFTKEEVKSLSIQIGDESAAYLQLKTDADAKTIKVKSYNKEDDIEYDKEDKELSIERDLKAHQGENDPIEVILPQNMKFDEVSVDMEGGGQFVADNLSANSMEFEISAGTMQIEEGLEAQSCEIEVGAGEVSINRLEANASEMNCGTGNLSVNMAGKREDYTVEAKVGLGSVQVGEELVESGIGRTILNDNPTGKELHIECGLGDVEVEFEEYN